MKIELSKKEYRNLLDLLAISEWVLNANAVGGDNPEALKYKKVEQKLLSYAKHHDCEDLIEYDVKLKEYFPTRIYEESEYRKFIDEYEEDTFWDELVSRLSHRDLLREVGEIEYKEMAFEERFIRQERVEEKYNIEFEKNGLKNLKLEE